MWWYHAFICCHCRVFLSLLIEKVLFYFLELWSLKFILPISMCGITNQTVNKFNDELPRALFSVVGMTGAKALCSLWENWFLPKPSWRKTSSATLELQLPCSRVVSHSQESKMSQHPLFFQHKSDSGLTKLYLWIWFIFKARKNVNSAMDFILCNNILKYGHKIKFIAEQTQTTVWWSQRGRGRQQADVGTEGKWGWKETVLGAMGTWCSVQMVFHWVIHLKPVWFCKPMSPQ